MQENYECDLDSCPGGYDGLHPNALGKIIPLHQPITLLLPVVGSNCSCLRHLGEYQIAQAFSRTLVNTFSIGKSELAIPYDIPEREIGVPGHLQAVSTDSSISVTWDHFYGSTAYEVANLLVGEDSWSFQLVAGEQFERQWVVEGWEYRFKVRSMYGDSKSDWSDIISIVYFKPHLGYT